MQVAVFHPGTQHSRLTALALQDAGRLAFLATSLFTPRDAAPLSGPFARRIEAERQRYRYDALDPANVRRHGLIEYAERIAARLGFARTARALDHWGNDRFGRWMARVAASEGPLALWGYDGSSRAAFADPRTRTLPRILDRTIGDWRAWNARRDAIEADYGEWLMGDIPQRSEAQLAYDDAEYAAATRIVCGSPFVAESILAHSRAEGLAGKLRVLPYSYDATLFGGVQEPQPNDSSAPVRFLFAGQVSARKGIPQLLEAIAMLPPDMARLTIAGPLVVPEALFARHADRIDYLGPVPRAEMPALMRRHDALVFPSYFEGSAITLLEALASGLAIIQTPEAGYGASSESGIVIAKPDRELIAEAMRDLASDRERLLAMRRAALREAAQFDFAHYRDNVVGLLADMGL